MSPTGQSSTALRLADTPDRVAVLAGAMRAFTSDPGSLEARRELDAAMLDCTSGDYEAAWGIAHPQETRGGSEYPGPPPGARMLSLVPAVRPGPVAAPGVPAQPVPRGWPASFLAALRAVNGDMVITWAMTATVAIVAVDAAIVSYSHIYDLAIGAPGNGTETGIQPHLLPLSIDGVIAEASLVMLFAARHKLPVPKLAWAMLVLGITATVAANVAHGLPSSLLSSATHDVISALLSAWPAGAFIGSVEMAMQLVRATRDVADTDQDNSADTDADNTPDSAADNPADRRADKPADSLPDIAPDNHGTARGPRGGQKSAKPADPVAVMIRRRPTWGDDRIAAECGVSTKTVKRRRDALAKAAPGMSPAGASTQDAG